MQGKRQHLKVAKACGKKVAKLENQAAKRQQTNIHNTLTNTYRW